MIIESEELLNEASLISNENLCVENIEKFDLKKVLRNYRVSHQYAINRTQLRNYRTLTDSVKIYEVDVCNKDFINEFNVKNIEFEIKNDGMITTLLYWFDYEAFLDENFNIQFDSFLSFSNFNLFLSGIMDYNSYEAKKDNATIKTKALLKHDIFHLEIEEILS